MNLLQFGFTDEYTPLRCRLCNGVVYKYAVVELWKNNPELNTIVKFGWCRKYTHGASVSKVVR